MNAPWWERKLGDFTGNLLAWLGKRAFDRGDFHEYGHILLALRAGDTGPRHVEPCQLHESLTLLREGRFPDA